MAPRKRDFRTVPLTLATAVLLALGLLALAGCGGGETTTTGATSAEKGLVVDETAVAEMKGGEFQQLVGEATDRLVVRHGGDEGAFYATLLALDKGYDVYQLLTGSLSDRVEADGRITAADGLTLSPARQPEGVIKLSVSETLLVASLSGPLLVADNPSSPGDAVITVGGTTATAAEVFQKILDRKKKAQEDAEDDTVTAGTEEWLRGYVTWWTTMLAARGYSTEQIVQGLVVNAERGEYPDVVPDSGDGTDEYICVYIWHTSGVMLKPKYPPVDPIQEMVCPVAPKDAPELFVKEQIKAAMAGGDSGSSGSGGAAPGAGEETSSAPDPGAHASAFAGTYKGAIPGKLFGESAAAPLEFTVDAKGGVKCEFYLSRVTDEPTSDGGSIRVEETWKGSFSGEVSGDGELRATGSVAALVSADGQKIGPLEIAWALKGPISGPDFTGTLSSATVENPTEITETLLEPVTATRQ